MFHPAQVTGQAWQKDGDGGQSLLTLFWPHHMGPSAYRKVLSSPRAGASHDWDARFYTGRKKKHQNLSYLRYYFNVGPTLDVQWLRKAVKRFRTPPLGSQKTRTPHLPNAMWSRVPVCLQADALSLLRQLQTRKEIFPVLFSIHVSWIIA